MWQDRMSAVRAVVLVVAGWTGIGGVLATAQEPARGMVAEVRDRAGMFGAGAIESARGELQRVAQQSGASIVIETIDSLSGQPAERVAIDLAQRSGIRGVFILLARKEHKLEVLGSGPYRSLLDDARRRTIIDAFLGGFRQNDFNAGLSAGIAALGRVLESTRPPEPVVARPSGSPPTSAAAVEFGKSSDVGLIERNRVRLTLDGARVLIAGAEAKARSMGWKMNVAVVDDGGHLIAFERMEGARPASGYTAMTKAITAATMRMPSGPFPPGTTMPDPLLNISLQNAASASGGKVTTLYGGVPVVIDGQVIGAVGCGGGSGEQDAEAARAGIQSLLEKLPKPAAAPSDH